MRLFGKNKIKALPRKETDGIEVGDYIICHEIIKRNAASQMYLPTIGDGIREVNVINGRIADKSDSSLLVDGIGWYHIGLNVGDIKIIDIIKRQPEQKNKVP